MERTDAKKRVSLICTHNAARSQMAEGFLRTLYSNCYEAYSAGTEPTRLHPCAVKVMQEAGIDISTYRSKSLDEFDGQQFDYIVTLCADAQEACPIFVGGTTYLHHAFDDPVQATSTEEEMLTNFRDSRAQIKEFIDLTFSCP